MAGRSASSSVTMGRSGSGARRARGWPRPVRTSASPTTSSFASCRANPGARSPAGTSALRRMRKTALSSGGRRGGAPRPGAGRGGRRLRQGGAPLARNNYLADYGLARLGGSRALVVLGLEKKFLRETEGTLEVFRLIEPEGGEARPMERPQ